MEPTVGSLLDTHQVWTGQDRDVHLCQESSAQPISLTARRNQLHQMGNRCGAKVAREGIRGELLHRQLGYERWLKDVLVSVRPSVFKIND
jgi:hypothetical protein